jgi:hypothetical protein
VFIFILGPCPAKKKNDCSFPATVKSLKNADNSICCGYPTALNNCGFSDKIDVLRKGPFV